LELYVIWKTTGFVPLAVRTLIRATTSLVGRGIAKHSFNVPLLKFSQFSSNLKEAGRMAPPHWRTVRHLFEQIVFPFHWSSGRSKNLQAFFGDSS